MFRQLVENPKLQSELKLNPLAALKVNYTIPERNLLNRGLYAVTKLCTIGDYWNRITEDMIVGEIPFENQCDQILQFTQQSSNQMKPLGLVLSTVDYFELGGSVAFLKEIATPTDWEKRGIKHHSVPMLDFGADVPVECIIHAIDKMKECVDSGKSIYIHCKAGHGRSAMHAAIYLAVFDKDCQDEDTAVALNKAIAKIKKCRPQIKLAKDKKIKAVEAIDAIKALQKRNSQHCSAESKEDIRPSLNLLLSSTLTKADIAQMTSFKELAIYAAFHEVATIGKTKRTQYIRDFLNLIYSAINADWFVNYERHVADLVNGKPWAVWDNSKDSFFGLGDKNKDKEYRTKLVADFLNELMNYLVTKLKCNKSSLERLVQNELVSNLSVKTKKSNWETETILKVAGGIALLGLFAFRVLNKNGGDELGSHLSLK